MIVLKKHGNYRAFLIYPMFIGVLKFFYLMLGEIPPPKFRGFYPLFGVVFKHTFVSEI